LKALSIKEPWASMIVGGIKTIETRTWQTKHRGDLLICVTKEPVFLLSGMAIAVVELVDCRLGRREDNHRARCDTYNKYCWILENIRKIHPFPVKGKQRLFEVEYPVCSSCYGEFLCDRKMMERCSKRRGV